MIAAIRTPFCALLLIVGAGCNGLGGASSTAVATQARPASSVETRAAEDTHKGRWPSPTLAPAEGWMTSTASSGGLATAEATTVPLHDPVGTFPGATLARLPANGIVILAWGYRPRVRLRPFPSRPRFPSRITYPSSATTRAGKANRRRTCRYTSYSRAFVTTSSRCTSSSELSTQALIKCDGHRPS